MPWSSYTLQCNNNIIWLNSVRTFRRFRLWHIDIYFNNKKSWQIEIIESWVPSWLTAVLHRLKSCNITSSTWLERTLQPVMVNSHGNWFISCTDHSSWAFIIATASVWLSCFLFSPCLGHVTFFYKTFKNYLCLFLTWSGSSVLPAQTRRNSDNMRNSSYNRLHIFNTSDIHTAARCWRLCSSSSPLRLSGPIFCLHRELLDGEVRSHSLQHS